MKKGVLVIFLFVLLLSSSVYAFSFVDFLQDFNDFIIGNVVSREIIEDVDKCEAKYLDKYKCSGDNLLRYYQRADCSIVYVNYESCDYGCSDGRCKEKVVEESVVDGDLGSLPFTESLVGDEMQMEQPQPVLSGYLTVATLKQNYLVGEQINLTDPPAEEGKGFFSKVIESVKNVFRKDVVGENLQTINVNSLDEPIDEQWSVNVPINSPSRVGESLVIGNINGGEDIEIILSSPGYPEYGVSGKIFVYDSQGDLVNGWPITLGGEGTDLISVGNFYGNVIGLVGYEAGGPNFEWEEECNEECGSLCEIYFPLLDEEYEDCVDRCQSYCQINNFNWGNDLYLWDFQGNSFEGWPINMHRIFKMYDKVFLSDVNNDGILDVLLNQGGYNYYNVTNVTEQVILISNEEFWSSKLNLGAKIYAFDIEGIILEGFPKDKSSVTYPSLGEVDDNKVVFWSGLNAIYPPIVYETEFGDFSVTFYNTLEKLEIENSESEKFCIIPYIEEGVGYMEQEWIEFAYLQQDFWTASSSTLVDINKDGELEILSTLFRSNFLVPEGLKIIACNPDGEIVEGFPVFFDNSSLLDPIPGWEYGTGSIFNIASSPVVGDLNKDGVLEIVISLEVKPNMLAIYVLDNEGNLLPNFPKSIYAEEGEIFKGEFQPIIADVDMDGLGDIIVSSSSGRIYGINYNGELILELNSLVSSGGGNNFQNPAVADLGGDGDLEIVTVTSDGKLISYDLESTGEIEWPMFHYNKEHTGLYVKNLPKSKIQNTGANNIQGYLLMKVEKNVNGEWQDYQIVVNDLETGTLRSIEGNSYLALDLIWNPYDVYIYEEGDYRVYVSLLDGNGNVINVIGDLLEDTYEFEVNSDVTNPEVEEVNI